MSELPLLQAGPPLEPRTETVDAPELGGAVVVRGLLASEAFAVSALRNQALRRVREVRAEYERRVAALPAGTKPPEFEAPVLDFDELRTYGGYLGHMLACAVTTANGLGLYTAVQWEAVGQHHPGLVQRLQAVAERLSGFNEEDVEKNSSASPS